MGLCYNGLRFRGKRGNDVQHFAYIDPGTGSLFLQAVIGVVLGGIFFFRRLIAKVVTNVKKVFKRNGRKEKEPVETEEQ